MGQSHVFAQKRASGRTSTPSTTSAPAEALHSVGSARASGAQSTASSSSARIAAGTATCATALRRDTIASRQNGATA
jgi:hypothetical protein